MKSVYKLHVEKEQQLILKVSEITHQIRLNLESSFEDVWIEGELSGVKAHSSGHLYFNLKDEYAQIQCAMFRRENMTLRFAPEEGMKVLCRGRVSVYPLRGQYQLYVQSMEPKGLGALALEFEQLKKRLSALGYFEESRKKTVPFFPSRIGIVTSLDTAALQDVLNILYRRFDGAQVLICPSPVQGPGAAASIAQAIEMLNEYEQVDVILVTRGGGSIEDLWAFNHEEVAHAIFHSRIPIISAIGHEVDFTIADFVADLRAPTPSAAAELVMPRKEDLQNTIYDRRQRLDNTISALMLQHHQQLTYLLDSRALLDPLYFYENQKQRLEQYTCHITSGARVLLDSARQRCLSLIDRLKAVGPLEVIQRGFCLAIDQRGHILRSVAKANKGEEITLKLADGQILSKILQITKGNI